MKRLRLWIVMEDQDYANSLRHYLMKEKFSECVVFTRRAYSDLSIEEYDWILLDDKNYRNILGIEDKATDHADRIILLTDCLEETDYEHVRTFYKYQPADRLWQYIVGKSMRGRFAEKQVPRCLSFVSPSGGVGKTVLSFYCAKSLALMGYKVLYVSFDYFFNSMGLLKTDCKENLSDFLFCLDRGMGDSMINDLVHKDIESGIYHFGSLKAYSDYSDIDDMTIKRLEKWLMDSKTFDYMVLDLCTGFSESFKRLYEFSSMNYLILDGRGQNHHFIARLDKLIGSYFIDKRRNIKYVINKQIDLRTRGNESEKDRLMIPYMEKREVEGGMLDYFTCHIKRELMDQ